MKAKTTHSIVHHLNVPNVRGEPCKCEPNKFTLCCPSLALRVLHSLSISCIVIYRPNKQKKFTKTKLCVLKMVPSVVNPPPQTTLPFESRTIERQCICPLWRKRNVWVTRPGTVGDLKRTELSKKKMQVPSRQQMS